jgi:hypothetical protein
MMNTTYTTQAPKLAQWLNPAQPARPLARYRLILREGESYTLPSSAHEVRIFAGAARILGNEREVALLHGETRAITAEQGGSVIYVLRDESLVFEIILDAASEEAKRMRCQFYERMAARQQLIEVEG